MPNHAERDYLWPLIKEKLVFITLVAWLHGDRSQAAERAEGCCLAVSVPGVNDNGLINNWWLVFAVRATLIPASRCKCIFFCFQTGFHCTRAVFAPAPSFTKIQPEDLFSKPQKQLKAKYNRQRYLWMQVLQRGNGAWREYFFFFNITLIMIQDRKRTEGPRAALELKETILVNDRDNGLMVLLEKWPSVRCNYCLNFRNTSRWNWLSWFLCVLLLNTDKLMTRTTSNGGGGGGGGGGELKQGLSVLQRSLSNWNADLIWTWIIQM